MQEVPSRFEGQRASDSRAIGSNPAAPVTRVPARKRKRERRHGVIRLQNAAYISFCASTDESARSIA
jgi:hypothetical protein